MNEQTLQQFRDALLRRWQRLDRSAGKEIENSAEIAEQPQAEIIDIAQSLEQIGRDVSLAEQERRELLAIERALAKMSTGTFGICEDCGEEIPPKRLMIVPETRFCASCQAVQERVESRHANFANNRAKLAMG